MIVKDSNKLVFVKNTYDPSIPKSPQKHLYISNLRDFIQCVYLHRKQDLEKNLMTMHLNYLVFVYLIK